MFVPPLLPQLDRANYKNVRHWDPDEYKGIRKGGNRGGKALSTDTPRTSVLSSYMEDQNGDKIPESIKRAVRHTAKGFFEGLLQRNDAPAAWGNVPLDVRHQFLNILERNFPFLRLCEGHWKANQVATNSYSQWYGNAADRRAAFQAKKASKVKVVIEVDANKQDMETTSKRSRGKGDNIPGPSKRPRVEGTQPTPPSRLRPTRVSPQGQKVCLFIYLDYLRS